MSFGMSDLFDREIALLPPHEKLSLATRILESLAEIPGLGQPNGSEEILDRQREALRQVCGIAHTGSSDASIRHAEIVYGPIKQ